MYIFSKNVLYVTQIYAHKTQRSRRLKGYGHDEVDRALLRHGPFVLPSDFLNELSLKRPLQTELKSNSTHGNKMRSYS